MTHILSILTESPAISKAFRTLSSFNHGDVVVQPPVDSKSKQINDRVQKQEAFIFLIGLNSVHRAKKIFWVGTVPPNPASKVAFGGAYIGEVAGRETHILRDMINRAEKDSNAFIYDPVRLEGDKKKSSSPLGVFVNVNYQTFDTKEIPKEKMTYSRYVKAMNKKNAAIVQTTASKGGKNKPQKQKGQAKGKAKAKPQTIGKAKKQQQRAASRAQLVMQIANAKGDKNRMILSFIKNNFNMLKTESGMKKIRGVSPVAADRIKEWFKEVSTKDSWVAYVHSRGYTVKGDKLTSQEEKKQETPAKAVEKPKKEGKKKDASSAPTVTVELTPTNKGEAVKVTVTEDKSAKKPTVQVTDSVPKKDKKKKNSNKP